MKFQALQSMVGTSPITGEEICIRPGDIVDWCEKEGPALVEAGIFATIASKASPETPEATRTKSKAKETR